MDAAAVDKGATFYFTLGDIVIIHNKTDDLLVEDNDDDAELTSTAFRQAGCQSDRPRARRRRRFDYLFARGQSPTEM